MVLCTGRPSTLNRPVAVLFLGLLKQERFGDVTMHSELPVVWFKRVLLSPSCMQTSEHPLLPIRWGACLVLDFDFDILSDITRIELHRDGAVHSLDETLHL